jgi:S1-C subfamily serine protease
LNGQIAPDAFPLPGDFGGGVIIGKQGEILTNYHLVKGSALIRVRGRGFVFDAEIIAADPRIDLAVIVPRPSATIATEFKPMTVGDAERLRQGSFLIALGNPYNAARDGKASASLGILSNTARKLDPAPSDDINIRRLFKFQPTLMQLDSRLNLGMSGGAIVNMRGELVGLTTSGASPVGYDAAAGYAIPMDTLGRRAVEELRQGKEVEYSFIGIGLASEPNTISQVQEGTPAWAANLMTGDRILAVGDMELADDESALPLALARVPVGEPVNLKVRRQGTVIDRTLVMSKYPLTDAEGSEVIATNRPAPWRGAQIDFTSMLGDGQRTDQTLGVMRRGGVGVMEVSSGSPAEAAGLQKGSVIKAVGGKPVSTPKQFRAAVAEFEGKPVELTILGSLESTQELTVPAR